MARTLRVKRPIDNPHRIDSGNNVVPVGGTVNGIDTIPYHALRGIRIDHELDEEQSDSFRTVIIRMNLVADAIAQIPIVSSETDPDGNPTPIIVPVGLVLLGSLSNLEPARILELESDAELISGELAKSPSDTVDVIFDWDYKNYDL